MVAGPRGFALLHLLAVVLLGQFWAGTLGLFITPLFIFVLIPLADAALGRDRRNPAPDAEAALLARPAYRALVWATLPVQLALVLSAAYLASHRPLGGRALADLLLSVGLMSGINGINAAHELVHRAGRGERLAGHLLLWLNGYLHWAIEHVLGHHRWVATPRDPATARRGESFYRFAPRVIAGELTSALRIEGERLSRRGRRPFGAGNRVLWFGLLEAALGAALWGAWGPRALVAWLIQCAVAVLTLQIINYIEHYGLRRAELAPGVYERVGAAHSWNASERLTNWFLFNLQRHADHHLHPGRRYQILRHLPDGPQLPAGYATLFLLTLIPPLWFRLMDPRLPPPPAPATTV